MIARFLSISLLAATSAVFGTACNRAVSSDPQPAASCEPPSEIPNPTNQWNNLIAGNPGLPTPITQALRNGAQEEAAGLNPCVAIREGRVGTVSMESHYAQAILQYQQALRLLDSCEEGCEQRSEIRRRVNDKISLLSISVETVADMNRRYLPSH